MSREPIAIVGIGCRFPGARDAGAFWSLLTQGRDAVREVPRERWDLSRFYDPDPAAEGKMNTRWGGFLEDIDLFDPQFFGISPREAESMDPQHRLLLEVTWEALEDAGMIPERLAGSQTAVFVGISAFDYYTLMCTDPANMGPHFSTGNTHAVAANRLSYVFDFHGPSVALDTACSSSLVAAHLGCRSLWSGESSLAIAGGAHLLLFPWLNVAYTKAGLMSPTGRCKAFDASADGYVRSEGAGMVVLKLLSQALADRDRIYAVIKGGAVNQDGRSNGLTAPNPKAQVAVLRAAYQDAGVSPSSVQYVEAHGTGTRLGDPIEMKSLAAVLRPGRDSDAPCWVGAVKSNIGHMEAAAGVAGLIKTALCLKHRQIPPSLHFKSPNPYIPFESIPLRVPTHLKEWPQGASPARAGVSAFGFGGTNAHLVLEEAPSAEPRLELPIASDRPRHILTLHTKSQPALCELAGRMHTFLSERPDLNLADVCYTANTMRSRFAHRLTVTAQSREEVGERLQRFAQSQECTGVAYAKVARNKRPKVGFLFSGLGSQYVGMGKQLYQTQPAFRAALERCDEVLRGQLDRPLLSLLYPVAAEQAPAEPDPAPARDGRRTFWRPTAPSLLDETVYAAPALFALEYALTELWRSWGVQPDYVLGHSLGELVAACAASAFSLEEGLRLVSERARLLQALPDPGAMAAVLAPAARLSTWLDRSGNSLSVAAVNGPEHTVVSGPRAAVHELTERLAEQGVKTQMLRVAQAAHSALIEPLLDAMEQVGNRIPSRPLSIPLVSNVTGGVLPQGQLLDGAYWRRQLREPVQFEAGLKALHAAGCELLLEIGPTPVLTYLSGQCLDGAEVRCLPSLVEHQDDWNVMLTSLSALYLGGVDVDWSGFDSGYPRSRIPLPGYPFERKRFWFPERVPLMNDSVMKTEQAQLLEPAAAAEPHAPEPPQNNPEPARAALRDEMVSSLRRMTAEVLKCAQPEVGTQTTFLEMGADSFALIELIQLIESKYGQEFSIRALFEDLPTIEALASEIASRTAQSVSHKEAVQPSASAAPLPPTAPQSPERPQHADPCSAQRQEIVTTLCETLAGMLRMAPSAIDPEETFLNLGADSTMLIEVVRLIQTRYRQKIAIRELFEDLGSVGALADYVEQRLPAPTAAAPGEVALAVTPDHARLIEPPPLTQRVEPAPAPVPPLPRAAGATPSAVRADAAAADRSLLTESEGSLERLFSRHIELLLKQVDLLRERERTLASPRAQREPDPPRQEPPDVPRPAAGRAVQGPAPPSPSAWSSGPQTPEPQLRAFTARYNQRTRRSKEWSAANRQTLADNRSVAGFRAQVKELCYPIVGERYKGARIWDLDGNEYIDLSMGFGVQLFGHGAPFIRRALAEQLETGFGIGPQPELAGEVAGLIAELTGAERVTFCQSGSEAVMTALRLARAATGREKIALFKGSYHGHFDGVLAQQSGTPLAPGVSLGATRDVIVLEYGEPSALAYLKQHAQELAAVLVEPVQSRRPDLQPREFLHELRALTRNAGTALIFDEIITGFRAHPGGAQAVFGVRADLATYGKVPGGGLPLAVVAGRAHYMDAIDGGAWDYGDASQPQAERTFFAGTFNKPPLALATARAVLRHLQQHGAHTLAELNERTARLVSRINQYFGQARVPAQVVHFGSLFRFVLKGNLDLFFYHLIDRGIYVWEGRTCFLSTAHTDADLDAIFQAVRDSMEELRAAGFFVGSAAPPASAAVVTDRAPGAVPQATGESGGPLSGREPLAAHDVRSEPPRHIIQPEPAAAAPSARPRRAREDMEFSLYYFGRYQAAFRADKYELLFDGARFADAHRFSAIWVPERHFHPFGGFSPNPSVLCAALARETERLHLRAGSVVVPLHHPVRIAEEWAVVDNLSGGRAGISIASGWHPDDFVFAPAAYGRHRELMFEGIETIRKLWRGESVRAAAGGQREVEARCYPLPSPRGIPIWVTIVDNPDTYARAGEIGAGVLTNLMSQTPEALARNIEHYRRAIEKRGGDPSSGHVTVLLHTYVGDDLGAVREKARQPFYDYLDTHFGLLQGVIKTQHPSLDLNKLGAEDRKYILSTAYDRYVRTSALIGTPASCVEIIDMLREAGVDELALFVDFGVEEGAVRGGFGSLAALQDLYRRHRSASPGSAVTGSGPRPQQACERIVPLTLAQREALTLVEMAATDTAIGASVCFELRGPLRLDSLRRALAALVARHETLRTTISPSKESFRIGHAGNVPLEVTHRTGESPELFDRAANDWLLAEGRKGFDLINGPVFRASLLSFDGQRQLLLLATHHALCDGWSIGVLVDELGKLYSADCQGVACPLPEVLQFREYVAAHEALRSTPEMQAHEQFWRARLAGSPPQLDLPTDRHRPRVKTYRASRHTQRIDSQVCSALHLVARENNASFFTLLLSAYTLLLHRLSGQDDLLVGIPVAGQIGEKGRALVGNCTNLLPIQSNLEGCERFVDLLHRTRATLLEAFEHREYSIHALVSSLPMPRDPSRIPLIAVVFNLDHASVPEMTGLAVSYWHAQPIEFALSETSLNAVEADGELLLDWNYNEDLFDAETVAGWREQYASLLTAIAASPRSRLAELSLLSEGDRRRILSEWNNTGTGPRGEECLHERFEQQALRTPDALAVAFGSEECSFRALSQRSSHLARHLRSLGVGPETRVALCLERSVDLIVAVLGIFKAGGAYVPLDPTYPPDRLAFLLADSRAAVLLTTSKLLEGLRRSGSTSTLCIDQINTFDELNELESVPAETGRAPTLSATTPQSAAYVIYTSGSTGQPRGVVVEHRSVVNLLEALQTTIYSRYASGPLRVALNGSIAFDTSVKQIIQILCGHALILLPEELRRDGVGLCQYLRAQRIQVLDCTPAQMRMLIAAGLLAAPGELRCVLVGGEAIDEVLWTQLSQAPIDFFNVYGPTECTVDATACLIRPVHPRPVLGHPLSNMRAYVLDRSLGLAPVGVPGELCIGGSGVARGYLGDPELTAARFLPDPFSPDPHGRLYRTGDKARFLRDGCLEFLGRLDHQIKVRGFRVEPAEIEAAILKLPAVDNCVVIGREVAPGDSRLIAYLVLRAAQAPAEQLRRALREHLPEYMIPTALVKLPALPLTSHGKIDRSALPEPDPLAFGAADAYVAPRSPTEEILVGIWADVLGLRASGAESGSPPAISVTANFFHLGGSSLLAMNVIDAIERRLGQSLRIQDLFADPTIQHLAEVIQGLNTWTGAVIRGETQTQARDRNILVKIKPDGDRAPLFFVAPLGGIYHATVIADILHIARYLDARQPYYGLQAPALAPELADPSQGELPDDWHYDPTRFDRIVSECMALLEETWSGAPCFLGGFCSGSLLALELARRMPQVAQVVLVDPPIDGPAVDRENRGSLAEDSLNPQLAAMSWFVAYTVGSKAGWKPEQLYEALAALPREQRWDHARDRLVAAGCLPDSVSAASLRRVFESKGNSSKVIRRVLQTVKPRPYGGAVTMLFSEQTLDSVPKESIDSALQGVREYLTGLLDVHFVKGTHGTLFREPDIQELMMYMNRCLAPDNRA